MEIAIIIVFFLTIIGLGFCRGFRNRSRRENAFYAICIALSMSILLLKSFDVPIPDPTKLFIQLLR
jgi:hypothetical protein